METFYLMNVFVNVQCAQCTVYMFHYLCISTDMLLPFFHGRTGSFCLPEKMSDRAIGWGVPDTTTHLSLKIEVKIWLSTVKHDILADMLFSWFLRLTSNSRK